MLNYTQLSRDMSEGANPTAVLEVRTFWLALCDLGEFTHTPAIQEAAKTLKAAIEKEYMQDHYVDPCQEAAIQEACSNLNTLGENGCSLFK